MQRSEAEMFNLCIAKTGRNASVCHQVGKVKERLSAGPAKVETHVLGPAGGKINQMHLWRSTQQHAENVYAPNMQV